MSFQYNGATISVGELTIGQAEDAADLARIVIGGGKEVKARHIWFGQYHVAAQVDGVEPIARVSLADDEKTIRAAYQAWRSLPDSFSDAWYAELSRVEKAVKNEFASPS